MRNGYDSDVPDLCLGVIKRFWAKAEVSDDEDACWPWKAAKVGKGYGVLKLENKRELAHRVAYRIYHGPIASSVIIAHGCDNPACVNPNHLFAGTHADNVSDREAHGRSVRRCKKAA